MNPFMLRKILSLTLAALLLLGSVYPCYAQEIEENPSVSEPTEFPPEDEAAPDNEAPGLPDNVEADTVPEDTPTEDAAEESEEPAEPEDAPEEDFPQYFQDDYAGVRYANGTIASDGCGITTLAMVATYMTGYEYTPDMLADYFGGHPGNNIDRLEYASQQLQLPFRKASNWHDAVAALEKGCIVIVLANARSPFTETQHFLVVRGITEDEKVLVSDPYRPNYDKWNLKDGFENGFTQGYLTAGYDGSWIYDPSAMPEDPYIYEPNEMPDPNPRYPQIHLTPEEEDLLAAVVWVEARGESEEGQQAVAEVALNRLKSGNYGETLDNVIFGEDQFRCVPFLDDAEPCQTQYDAIKRAIRGPYVLDEGVVHFARAATNDKVWGRIGGHVFCYDS